MDPCNRAVESSWLGPKSDIILRQGKNLFLSTLPRIPQLMALALRAPSRDERVCAECHQRCSLGHLFILGVARLSVPPSVMSYVNNGSDYLS